MSSLGKPVCAPARLKPVYWFRVYRYRDAFRFPCKSRHLNDSLATTTLYARLGKASRKPAKKRQTFTGRAQRPPAVSLFRKILNPTLAMAQIAPDRCRRHVSEHCLEHCSSQWCGLFSSCCYGTPAVSFCPVYFGVLSLKLSVYIPKKRLVEQGDAAEPRFPSVSTRILL